MLHSVFNYVFIAKISLPYSMCFFFCLEIGSRRHKFQPILYNDIRLVMWILIVSMYSWNIRPFLSGLNDMRRAILSFFDKIYNYFFCLSLCPFFVVQGQAPDDTLSSNQLLNYIYTVLLFLWWTCTLWYFSYYDVVPYSQPTCSCSSLPWIWWSRCVWWDFDGCLCALWPDWSTWV